MTKHNKIPNGWHETEFFNIAEVSKEKYNPKKELINYKCLELEHLSQETSKILGYIDVNKTNSIKNKFYKGDILFGKLRPYLKKHVIPNFDGVCSSEIWVLKPKNNINNKYLFNLITTFKFIQVANASAGSKMPRSDWTYMREYVFKIPRKIEEQEKIAGVLEVWDAAISNIQKQITNAQQTKKALMQQLLTPKPHWQETTLGQICELLSGYAFSSSEFKDSGIPIIRISNLYNNAIDLEDVVFSNKSLDSLSKFLIYKDDLIVAMSGATTGKMAVNNHNLPMFLNQRVGLIRANKCSQIFINQLLSRSTAKILAMSYGGAQPNVGVNDLKKIKVSIPPLPEQQHIAQVLTNADEVISNLESQLANVQRQKKALMQKLLTGDVRFNEFCN